MPAADSAGRTQQARTPPGDDVWDAPANHGEGARDALGPRGIGQRCGDQDGRVRESLLKLRRVVDTLRATHNPDDS